MKKMLLLIVLALLPVFAGCEKTEPETTAPLPTYTVTFSVRGHIVSEQTVTQGQCPQVVEPQVQGLSFAHWLDENQAQADPFTVPVFEDTRYTAYAYPALTEHVPYLFANHNGSYEPDRPLSPDELLTALEALAAPGARDYFPGMPVGSGTVSGELLRSVLEGFFPTQAVEEAFPENGSISRRVFSRGMNQLLGRAHDSLTLAPDTTVSLELMLGQRDPDFLEAVLPHTCGGTDSWQTLELPYTPGYMNLEGWLYYVNQDGTLLANGVQDGLTFGADGRYTSGDLSLDSQVAQILAQIITDNPDVTGLDLLRKAYEYSRDSFEYERRWEVYQMGQTGWEIQEALDMLEKGKGNCYSYAAVFWALARGLGYPAEAISGTCTGTDQPHGWVRIVLDGVPYFFDPEWEMDYRVDRHIFHMDMFMLEMDEIYYWTYKWKEE